MLWTCLLWICILWFFLLGFCLLWTCLLSACILWNLINLILYFSILFSYSNNSFCTQNEKLEIQIQVKEQVSVNTTQQLLDSSNGRLFVIEPYLLARHLSLFQNNELRWRFDLPVLHYNQTSITLGTFDTNINNLLVRFAPQAQTK